MAQVTPSQLTKLNEIFNQFAGKEVMVVSRELGGLKDKKMVISASDKTIAELRKAIEDLGLQVRVLMPGDMKTQDARPDRVNVYVGPGFTDGKYRVSKNYKIG